MTEHICSCAVCMGIEPFTARFPECMTVRFANTAAAIAAGTATRVPR